MRRNAQLARVCVCGEMLRQCVLLAARSPIKRLEHRAFRGTPKPRRLSSLSLDSALAHGDPHSITVAFLRSAHHECHGGTRSDLRRVLSCALTKEVLLCACAAVATPEDLWPIFITQRVRMRRGGKNATLGSPSWRAFFFVLVQRIHFTKSAQVDPWLPALCATCLAPFVELGERLAEVPCMSKEGSSTVVSADAALAFAACCSMSDTNMARNDAVWLRLWAKIQTSAPCNASHPAWVRCHELQLHCFMRTRRYTDIETSLLEMSPSLLHRMSEATLAQLFLLETLGAFARRSVLSALLLASQAKSDVLTALRLTPFERNAGLPSVTRNISLFAQVMRYLVLQARSDPSTSSCLQVLRDIEGLCRISNSYALAASLVPNSSNGECVEDKSSSSSNSNSSSAGGETLMSIMTATPSKQRARLLAALVAAIGEVADLACDFSRRMGSHDDRVDATLRGCIGLLTDLFTLCSNRKGEHPLHRKPEPEWRRRLQRGVTLRSHKYELLCGELPHTVLSRCISTLLANGFVFAGGSLGCRLAAADFVDLHFYSLRLLGSLYHAARVVRRQEQESGHWQCQQGQEKPDVLTVIRSLYQRRREVFGEDVSASAQHACATESSGGALVPHMVPVPPLALQHNHGEHVTTGLGLLLARSSVAAGGSFVVDSSFGVWLRKGTTEVSK